MNQFTSHLDNPPMQAGYTVGPNRAANEYYPTPPEATKALLSTEHFDGTIWEPACGEGWLSSELIRAGYDVVSTDLVDYGFGLSGVDFLAEKQSRARHIVTNPPYGSGLADRFIRQALGFIDETGGKAAMLLNLASLCHPSRHDSFIRRPPTVIYALDECVCYPNGDPKQATNKTLSHRYCWMIWDAVSPVETKMRWLSTRPFANHLQ